MKIAVEKIHVKEGRRGLDEIHVKELAESIRELGMLNPLTVDREYNLIAGLHRLEAVKQLGFKEVECAVSSLEGLQAELAEIDENIVRSGLSAIEYGEILLRRKAIYETLHPETKHGGDRKSEGIKRTKCPLDPIKSFVEDTAEKGCRYFFSVKLLIQRGGILPPLNSEKNVVSYFGVLFQD